MKKSISVILLISFMVLTLIGCSNTETPQNNPSDTTATNSDSTPVFTDPIKDYDTVDDSSTEGFTVKAKKYKYEDNNILLLSVKNTTNTNCSVSVSVDFCDSTGNTVKTEAQTFEGYAAGYEKLFLFEPNITFDSYTYKVTAEEYTGECYAQNIDVWFGELYEDFMPSIDGINNGDLTKYPYIVARCYYKNLNHTDLITTYNLILIDNTGEIFTILKGGGLFNSGSKGDGYQDHDLIQFVDGKLVWPEELKDGVSGICTIENISLYEKK